METSVYVCALFVVAANLNFDYHAASLENGKFRSEKEDYSSSVLCHSVHEALLCTFKNLCYTSKEKQFIFTLTEQSIIHGLDSKKDFESIHLSSVLNHNVFHLNLAIVKPSNSIFSRPRVKHEAVFLLWRFKCDNIMHVMHDDLLPLYFTYLDICEFSVDTCCSKFQLAFVDNSGKSPFDDLYRLFSNEEPLFLPEEDKSSLLCFNIVQAGLLSTTVWFQYGFGMPQGPLNNTDLHESVLQGFKRFIVHKLNVPHKEEKDNVIVIFSRKLNRKILNEDYVVSTVLSVHGKHDPSNQAKVIVVDFSTHNISSIIEALLTSRIVVGMHGSAMILCLFLEPGSVVVELFPFGISAIHVSHVKALSKLPGVGLIYRSWENSVEANSQPHPERSPLLGGISHLSEETQRQIRNTKIVPAVHCCHNPLYLYRMFQDTVVGEDFAETFEDALLKQSLFSKEKFQEDYIENKWSKWYFLAPVTNIQCFEHDGYLKINWSEPTNIQNTVLYEIALLVGRHQPYSVRTAEAQLDLHLPVEGEAVSVDIWIKAISAHAESKDEYFKCSDQRRNS